MSLATKVVPMSISTWPGPIAVMIPPTRSPTVGSARHGGGARNAGRSTIGTGSAGGEVAERADAAFKALATRLL
eukprot:9600622-Heterocapsa_arctica.AAC.1